MLLPQNILAIFARDKIFMVLFLGCRMSGLKAGCPGITTDVRASRQISGPSHSSMQFCVVLLSDVRPSTPDVRAPSARRMSGLLGGYPGIGVQKMFLWWAARRMSGHLPDVRPPAGCPGLPVLPDVRAWPPDVRPLCSQLWFWFLFLISCQAGCPAPCPDVRPAPSLTLQRPYSCSRYIYPFFSTGEG